VRAGPNSCFHVFFLRPSLFVLSVSENRVIPEARFPRTLLLGSSVNRATRPL
jgi:hypothetical protein